MTEINNELQAVDRKDSFRFGAKFFPEITSWIRKNMLPDEVYSDEFLMKYFYDRYEIRDVFNDADIEEAYHTLIEDRNNRQYKAYKEGVLDPRK